MTAPVTGATTVPTSTATTTVARKDSDSSDMFLKLLVAQMKYQDPSKPADTNEMLSQQAAYTQVEKLEELTTQNASLVTLQKSLSAGALVGRTVAYTDANGAAQTGVVSSVKIGDGDPTAVVNGVDVAYGRLTQIGLPVTT